LSCSTSLSKPQIAANIASFLAQPVQKKIIASKISDISFQVSDFNFQIGTLMFESHALEQKLLVLFTVLSSPKPPVINCPQSTTCIEETTRNHYKPP
jgi:hypothetical protein